MYVCFRDVKCICQISNLVDFLIFGILLKSLKTSE